MLKKKVIFGLYNAFDVLVDTHDLTKDHIEFNILNESDKELIWQVLGM